MSKHLGPEPERPPMPLGRRIAIVAGVIALAAISVIAGFSLVQHKSPLQVVAGTFVPSPQSVFKKNNLLVLVVGLDYDYNDKDEETSAQSRSDIIKAINLDFTRKQIFELSVPRDMDVVLPNGQEAKINQAQSDGGIKESQTVVAHWLGIPPFDRYIILRIDSMKQVINAIGGINVNVKDSDCLAHHECTNQSSLDYVDTWGHLYVHLHPGLQHMNGDQAVGYARFRHDWCSDPCRIMRQDQVVRAILDKIKTNKLNTFLHAADLIGVFRRDVTTNLTQGEMLALANYYLDISQKQIHQAEVPYVADKTIPQYGDVIVPDESAKAHLVQTMMLAPPIPQPPVDPVRVAAIAPASVVVDVENGSGVPGVAHKLASVLQKQGFKIGTVGDAPSDVSATEIHEHSQTPLAGARVRLALPATMRNAAIIHDGSASGVSNAASTSDVTIIIGPAVAQ